MSVKKTKLNIWILQTGEPLFSDKSDLRPMRAMNLAAALKNQGHKIKLVSSQFFHQKKSHRRNIVQKMERTIDEKLIWSPGYKKNIGIGRFLDHLILGINLSQYLIKELKTQKPDLFFVGFPPVEWTLIAVLVAKLYSIKVVVDVKDLWPDLFFEKTNSKTLRSFLKIVFSPYTLSCVLISNLADAISSPTRIMGKFFINKYQNYLKFKNLFNFANQKVIEAPLVPPSSFDIKKVYEESYLSKNDSSLKLIFFGSLMSIFDFKTVELALNELDKSKIKYKLIIIGSGGNESEIKAIFKYNKNVFFTGWLNYSEILPLAKESNVAIAPYQKIQNYNLNIPNKIIDYFSLSLPVICPLDGCVKELFKTYEVGWSYRESDYLGLYNLLKTINDQSPEVEDYSKNALNLYNKKYLFGKVYSRLIKELESLF